MGVPGRRARPTEHRALERGRVLGIGDVLGVPAEGGELGPPALAHGLGRAHRSVVGEVLERRATPPTPRPGTASGTNGAVSSTSGRRDLEPAGRQRGRLMRSPWARLPIWSWFCEERRGTGRRARPSAGGRGGGRRCGEYSPAYTQACAQGRGQVGERPEVLVVAARSPVSTACRAWWKSSAHWASSP